MPLTARKVSVFGVFLVRIQTRTRKSPNKDSFHTVSVFRPSDIYRTNLVFLEKDVLKICVRFTGEHSCQSVLTHEHSLMNTHASQFY